MLVDIHNKQYRKIVESSIIFNYSTIVALWGQAAKADESVLARNQTKDSWTWNLAVSGSGKGTRERELTTRPRREQLVVGQEREEVGGWRAERQAAEEKLAWKNGGAVNTRHRNREARRQKGSSEEESQDVWFQ